MLAGLPVIADRMGAITVMINTMIAQDTCHNGSLPIDEQSQDFCLPPPPPTPTKKGFYYDDDISIGRH